MFQKLEKKNLVPLFKENYKRKEKRVGGAVSSRVEEVGRKMSRSAFCEASNTPPFLLVSP